jgi:nicotinate-nucleotide adenylyltransferase
MKIGVLGGTFDPIHRGHLAVASEARRRVHLDKVIFMPAGHPYFKDAAAISAAEDRLNMIKLALRNRPYCKISRLELERSGPSYSVETIDTLKSQADPDDEFFFIMGWDSLMDLYRWFEADRLIQLCRIVAVPRPGYPSPNLTNLEKKLAGISGRAVILDKPFIDISATAIRERVRNGLSIEALVPTAVARYIAEKGLYRI